MKRVLILVVVILNLGGCESIGRQTIKFWQFWPVSKIQPLIDQFESDHPGVRVEVEQLTWKDGLVKIRTALADGAPPDLCELGSTWLARFAHSGVLEDLSGFYETQTDSFLMWDGAVWRGKAYGIPWVQGAWTLFYNRELFRRAGLDPDSPPRTWDQLLAAARAIDGLGKDISGFGQNLGKRHMVYKGFMSFAWSNGGRILDDDGKVRIDDSAMLEALEYYLRLSEYSLQAGQEVLEDRFRVGRLGMQISGAWNLEDYLRESPELDYGVALVPKPTEDTGSQTGFAGVEMLVVFKGTNKTEISLELAEFLLSYPQTRRLSLGVGNVFPASVQLLQDSTYTNKNKIRTFIEQSFSSRTTPAHPGWIEMEDVVSHVIEETLAGQRAPRWCLSSAAEDIERIVARYEQ